MWLWRCAAAFENSSPLFLTVLCAYGSTRPTHTCRSAQTCAHRDPRPWPSQRSVAAAIAAASWQIAETVDNIGLMLLHNGRESGAGFVAM